MAAHVVRRNPNVVYRRETRGGTVEGLLLFNYSTRGIHFLEGLAAKLWEVCEGKSAEEIAHSLKLSKAEVERFLGELEARRLVRYKGEGSEGDNEALSTSGKGMWSSRVYFDSPIFVQFDVTNACNLRCAHCVTSSGEPLENELSTQEALSLIDELASLGVFQIGFSGGEALLRRDIFTLMEHAKKRGIKVQLTTNATLISEATAKKLVKLEPITVGVSLEGATKQSYGSFRGEENFERALSGVRALLRHSLPVKLKVAVSRRNLSEVDAILKLALELGVEAVDMFLLYPEGRARSMKGEALSSTEIKEFLTLLARRRREYEGKLAIDVDDKPNAFLVDASLGASTCGAGAYWAEVLPNGDVVPCIFLRSMRAGNVREASFKEIWQGSVWEPLRSRRLKGRCGECEHASRCGGGCRANALLLLGDIMQEDALCWYGG